MTDIFISYAREDRPVAQALARLLEQRGYDVWWDAELVTGDAFRATIRDKLANAKKVIVIWSDNSTRSQFVIDESSAALEAGKLVPIAIEDVQPPMGFRGLQTLSVWDWESEIDNIVAAIEGQSVAAIESVGYRRLWRRALPWLVLAIGALAVLVAFNPGLLKDLPGEASNMWRRLQGERKLAFFIQVDEGSRFYRKANGDKREFFYWQPSEAAVAKGAKRKQLYFSGNDVGDRYQGEIHVVSETCPKKTFAVAGPIVEGGTAVELAGKEPVFDDACTQVGENDFQFVFRYQEKKWVNWK